MARYNLSKAMKEGWDVEPTVLGPTIPVILRGVLPPPDPRYRRPRTDGTFTLPRPRCLDGAKAFRALIDQAWKEGRIYG